MSAKSQYRNRYLSQYQNRYSRAQKPVTAALLQCEYRQRYYLIEFSRGVPA